MLESFQCSIVLTSGSLRPYAICLSLNWLQTIHFCDSCVSQVKTYKSTLSNQKTCLFRSFFCSVPSWNISKGAWGSFGVFQAITPETQRQLSSRINYSFPQFCKNLNNSFNAQFSCHLTWSFWVSSRRRLAFFFVWKRSSNLFVFMVF